VIGLLRVLRVGGPCPPVSVEQEENGSKRTVTVNGIPVTADALITLRGSCSANTEKSSIVATTIIRASEVVPVVWGHVENCDLLSTVGGIEVPVRFDGDFEVYVPTLGTSAHPVYLVNYEITAITVAGSIGLVPGYFGGNWLGTQYDPFQTGGDPNNANFQVQNLNLPSGLSIERLEDRRTLLSSLDRISRAADNRGTFEAMDRFDHEALELISGERARKAFDLGTEDPRLRDRYGRHNWGQSTLLARRLVEAGATFVTVHYGGWDHHWNLKAGMESYLPMVDSAVSALFEDLDQRGMLDSTLVILCGEFSRTPRMNDGGNGGPAGSMGTPGRDHWGEAMFCLLGGGGVKGGQLVGSTDARGQYPQSRPLRPEHLHATIYQVLGIDPTLHLLDHSGRPIPVLEDPTPVHELL
jgi:hypothetical protein